MKIRVGMVLTPAFQIADLAGPAAVFETASYFAGKGRGYHLSTLSLAGGAVPSSSGISSDSQKLSQARQLDTLMVVGGTGARTHPPQAELTRWLLRRARTCRRITSVCTGSFVLAGAGLLDGRKVTSHWRYCGELQRQYPRTQVMPDRIWVRDGKFWSSAGVVAGIDLALALVADDYGAEVAQRTAREIVVYYNRPGGQSQFSTLEELKQPGSRFTPLLSWAREHITDTLRVEDLATHMAMSPRNFARRFKEELGLTPAEAVNRLRFEHARALVESSRLSLQQVANRSGYRDAEIMRRAFVKFLGRPPRSLRAYAPSSSAPR